MTGKLVCPTPSFTSKLYSNGDKIMTRNRATFECYKSFPDPFQSPPSDPEDGCADNFVDRPCALHVHGASSYLRNKVGRLSGCVSRDTGSMSNGPCSRRSCPAGRCACFQNPQPGCGNWVGDRGQCQVGYSYVFQIVPARGVATCAMETVMMRPGYMIGSAAPRAHVAKTG